jgi:uncharacterized membrane protein YoaK (UPF0700 family)
MLNSPANILLACALCAVAGYVDGLGFLHLGGLFVSFMSGNTTRLGVGLAQSSWWTAAEALGLIALFVTGAVTGSLIVRRGQRYSQASVLLTETVLLAIAGIVANFGWTWFAVSMIVIAMGLENAVFQVGGAGGLGLTYVTGALVRMGQLMAAALSGGARWAWAPELLLWTAMALGAALGAVAYLRLELQSIWFAAAATLIIGMVLTARARARH